MMETRNAKKESKYTLEWLFINNCNALIFDLAALHGEMFQYQSSPYYDTWLAGHFSDFCSGAVIASMGLMAAGTRRNIQKIVPAIAAGALSLDEYLHIINPDNKVTDFQDVLCYVAGAYAAYGVSKAVEKCLKLFDYSFLENAVSETF